MDLPTKDVMLEAVSTHYFAPHVSTHMEYFEHLHVSTLHNFHRHAFPGTESSVPERAESSRMRAGFLYTAERAPRGDRQDRSRIRILPGIGISILNSNGLHWPPPTSNGLQPKSNGLQPKIAMASNLIAMASNLIAMASNVY